MLEAVIQYYDRKRDSIIDFLDQQSKDVEKSLMKIKRNAITFYRENCKKTEDTLKDNKFFEILFKNSFQLCVQDIMTIIKKNNLKSKPKQELDNDIFEICKQFNENIRYEIYDYVISYKLNKDLIDLTVKGMEESVTKELPQLLEQATKASSDLHTQLEKKLESRIDHVINEISDVCRYIDKDVLKKNILTILTNNNL
jgi:hypothetical protein